MKRAEPLFSIHRFFQQLILISASLLLSGFISAQDSPLSIFDGLGKANTEAEENQSPPLIPAYYQVGPFSVTASKAQQNWSFFPFLNYSNTERQKYWSITPFYSVYEDKEQNRKSTHVLWPLWRSERRAQSWAAEDRTSTSVFPIFHRMKEVDERYGPNQHQYLFPFYFQGSQKEANGRYFILFPFIWYAENARLVVPLFPKRPQTFAAFWPFIGHFENYWNRHTIDYVLWPLFVRSIEGAEETNDKITHYSFIWPIFGLYKSDVMGGFNVWPLISRVEKPDEYIRAYWLWPLGHYRYEKVPEWEDKRSEQTWFIPFFASANTPNYKYDLVFPFYGELDMKGRRSRGYALAIYNTNENFRSSIRNHRLFWFLIRWTTKIDPNPRYNDFTLHPEPLQGGGVFPFYVNQWNSSKRRVLAPWPIYSYRKDVDTDQIYTRQFLFPFFARTEKEFPAANGEPQRLTQVKRYVWPFYRKTTLDDDSTYTNIPHLFPILDVNEIDRNYAPFWSLYRAERDPKTGARNEQILGSIYRKEKEANGTRNKQLNLLVYKGKWSKDAQGNRSGEVKILFGLIKSTW
ncbi:MAG: hypothetical protein ACFCU1_00980 [Sumerlaeia bacterium]